MTRWSLLATVFSGMTLLSLSACAGTTGGGTVEAPVRTHGQNYKDMVLASCIARAYKSDTPAGKDASSSASVFIDWTLYDVEKSSAAIDSIIERYLARDYGNPLVEYRGTEFNLLKCLDMYHSKELSDQVRHFVPHPNRTYRMDYPPRR